MKAEKCAFLSKRLFTPDEVLGEYNSCGAAFVALNKLQDKGLIVKLCPGLYATVNQHTGSVYADRFEIATALRPDGYCAYHTALEYYGWAEDKPDIVEIINPIQEKPTMIGGREYVVRICKYTGNIEEHRNGAVRITSPERTIIDCIGVLRKESDFNEMLSVLKNVHYLSENKLLECMEGYNRKYLYKKAGWLFSKINPNYLSERFYDACRDNMSMRCDAPFGGKGCTLDTEWMIYVPEQAHGRGLWR